MKIESEVLYLPKRHLPIKRTARPVYLLNSSFPACVTQSGRLAHLFFIALLLHFFSILRILSPSMKTTSVLLLIFFTATLAAQEISPLQAKRYADMLVKKQLLTEKGKDILLTEFQSKSIDVEHPSTVYDTTYIKTEQSKQAMLVFLTRAFGSGLLHRQYDKKNNIERKIVQEDKLLPANIYTTMVLGLGGYQYQDCIHPKRSTIGATPHQNTQ